MKKTSWYDQQFNVGEKVLCVFAVSRVEMHKRYGTIVHIVPANTAMTAEELGTYLGLEEGQKHFRSVSSSAEVARLIIHRDTGAKIVIPVTPRFMGFVIKMGDA